MPHIKPFSFFFSLQVNVGYFSGDFSISHVVHIWDLKPGYNGPHIRTIINFNKWELSLTHSIISLWVFITPSLLCDQQNYQSKCIV